MSPIFYVSREKSFYSELGFRRIFYGGLFFKAWGSYPVKVGLNDYASSLTEQIRIIRDGGSICIFPEGGTTKDGQFKKAKAGVSYLSQVTRTSIIPVYIGNTFRLSLVDIFLRRRSLIVIYGKEIDPPPVDSSIDDLKVHANSIMDVILELKNSI